jgi:hypothetical protein
MLGRIRFNEKKQKKTDLLNKSKWEFKTNFNTLSKLAE